MEVKGTFWQRISFKEVVSTIWLPFRFLVTEPIVTFLSLLSGFSDALIFTGLDSFPLVLSKWNFSVIAVGLAFIPLLIGCEFPILFPFESCVMRWCVLWSTSYDLGRPAIAVTLITIPSLGAPLLHASKTRPTDHHISQT